MSDEPNRKFMDLKEFVDQGFLQEVNRQFFHPLGLALAVEETENHELFLKGIIDNRLDEEGMVFEKIDKEKIEYIRKIQTFFHHTRFNKLGFVIQNDDYYFSNKEE